MSQYIGKTISLISSKGIRYVGVLQDVNGEAATVTLNNVKPFGTEGRLGDPAKEIPPSEDVFPVVVFKGSDVHDLSVLDDEPAPAPAPPSAPAQQPPQQQPQAKDDDSDDEPKYQRQPRAPRQPRPNAFNSKVPTDDFDFGSSDAIDELRHQEEDAADAGHGQEAPAYDKKKSFFDTISSSANEPARPQRNFHSRGRGRGGNWSRGGRGRGRGGYNNQPSWA